MKYETELEFEQIVDKAIEDLMTNPLIYEEFGNVDEEEIKELIEGGFIPLDMV